MPPTRRINARATQTELFTVVVAVVDDQCYHARPHHYVSRRRRRRQTQQPDRPPAAGTRSRDAATRRCERHCSSRRRAERTNSRRQRWDIGVEPTGNDAMRPTAGHSIHRRSCMFNVFRMNTTSRSWLHTTHTTSMSAWCKWQRRKTTTLSAVSILIATAADGDVLLVLVRRHRHHCLFSYPNLIHQQYYIVNTLIFSS